MPPPPLCTRFLQLDLPRVGSDASARLTQATNHLARLDRIRIRQCDTIDRSGMDAEPYDPARVLINDNQDPVGTQRLWIPKTPSDFNINKIRGRLVVTWIEDTEGILEFFWLEQRTRFLRTTAPTRSAISLSCYCAGHICERAGVDSSH
jgi:hypothetical protein